MSEVLTQYKNFTDWLQQLKQIPEEYWLVPIKDGKWSVGEIVAHIKAWDIFVWDERGAYFVSGAEIPVGKSMLKKSTAMPQMKQGQAYLKTSSWMK